MNKKIELIILTKELVSGIDIKSRLEIKGFDLNRETEIKMETGIINGEYCVKYYQELD